MPYTSERSRNNSVPCNRNQGTHTSARGPQASETGGTPQNSSDGSQASDRRQTNATKLRKTSPRRSADDGVLYAYYSRNIDYLGHNWEEEHIWLSWKFIISGRGQTSNPSRLENAAWRAWAKCKNNLGTVSPTTINWLRDNDVHCLYGPFRSSAKEDYNQQATPSALSRYNPPRRSILKGRSRSDVLFQATRSSPSLFRQAAADIQTHEERHWKGSRVLLDALNGANLDTLPHCPTKTRHNRIDLPYFSEPSSGAREKRIQFCNEVEQRISIQNEDGDESTNTIADEDNMNAFDYVIMKLLRSLQPGTPKRKAGGHSRDTSSTGLEMIAMLPPTTLHTQDSALI